jgi:hypothetical protein
MSWGEPREIREPSRRFATGTKVISEPLGAKSLGRGRMTGAVVPDFPEVPPSVDRSQRRLPRPSF